MFESFCVDSLTFSYKKEKILNTIYLYVEKSEIVGLLGRNGSGKTSLFNTLTLSHDYSGSVFINKTYIEKKELAKYIAYLPQNEFLPNEKSVLFIIDMFPIEWKVKNLIKENSNIEPLLRQKYGSLSSGEKRLLEFLLINSLEKQIIILDEPFGQIEPLFKEVIKNRILDNENEKVYIISDHNYDDLKTICSTLYLLKESNIIKIKDESELISYEYLPGDKN